MPQLVNCKRLMDPDEPPAAGGAADPCATGQWDFTLECQSGELLTLGIM